MSSPPAQRRRVVGLANPNPRAARQVANESEIQRNAERAVIRELHVEVDLTSSEDESYEGGGSGNSYDFNQEDGGDARQYSLSPPPAAVQDSAGPPRPPARSRTQWQDNHQKLNLMARFVCNL